MAAVGLAVLRVAQSSVFPYVTTEPGSFGVGVLEIFTPPASPARLPWQLEGEGERAEDVVW